MGLGIIKTENNYLSFYIIVFPNHAYVLVNFYLICFVFQRNKLRDIVRKVKSVKLHYMILMQIAFEHSLTIYNPKTCACCIGHAPSFKEFLYKKDLPLLLN